MLYKFEYIWKRNIIMYKRSNTILPYLHTNKDKLKAVYFCEKLKKTHCIKSVQIHHISIYKWRHLTLSTKCFLSHKRRTKASISTGKNEDNFLTINSSKLKQKTHMSELTADWASMKDCLITCPKMGMWGGENYKLRQPKKNCSWIVADSITV